MGRWILFMGLLAMTSSLSFAWRTTLLPRAYLARTTRLSSTTNENERRFRPSSRTDATRPAPKDDWDTFDPTNYHTQRTTSDQRTEQRTDQRTDGWDSDDDTSRRPPPPRRATGTRGSATQWRSNSSAGNFRSNTRSNGPRTHAPPRYGNTSYGNNGYNKEDSSESDSPKINLRALELAGWDHVYGLASVLNALSSTARDLSPRNDDSDNDSDSDTNQRTRKPEAQFTPYLFVQQSTGARTARSSDKQAQAQAVLDVARARQVPLAYVDKGILNTLSLNRPHQGYVLRCGALDVPSLSTIPLDDTDSTSTVPYKPVWLVLDEVVDPQNLGALLRSAYFLGGPHRLGVLVCRKNSAPLSPTVSAASAGALEGMLQCCLYSTSNLPHTLAQANAHGCRIVGASSSVPTSLNVPLYSVHDWARHDDTDTDTRPTLLVLGSEGHGLRALVAHSCTEFVRIPSHGNDSTSGVDSLNVSVTGGILLWHLLRPH